MSQQGDVVIAPMTSPLGHASRGSNKSAPSDAPWQIDPRVWLPRIVSIRLLSLVPIVGLLLMVSSGGRASLSLLFGVVLLGSLFNLALFLWQRHANPSVIAARRLLFASLLVDLPLILTIADRLGGLAGPVPAFLILPMLVSTWTLEERDAWILTGVGGALLFAIEPTVVSMATLLLLGGVATMILWSRRQGRFLEERVAILQGERGELQGMRRGPLPVVLEPFDVRVTRGLAGRIETSTETLRQRLDGLRAEVDIDPRYERLIPELEQLIEEADRLGDARDALSTEEGDDPVEPTSLLDAVREVKEAVPRDWRKEGVRIRMESRFGLPNGMVEFAEAKWVASRLLEAVKRAAEHQSKAVRIDIRFGWSGDHVWFSIEDSLPVTEGLISHRNPDRKRPGHIDAIEFAASVAERRGGEVKLTMGSRRGLVVRVGFPVESTSVFSGGVGHVG